MKLTPIVLLGIAVVVLAFVLLGGVSYMNRNSGSEPELDQRQEKRTMQTEDSSYAQRTNHFPPASVDMGPIHGYESPFRVNQFMAYIP